MKLDVKQSWIKNFPNRRFQIRLVGSDFEPHQREFHIFALIKQGQIKLRYRERNYIINQGDTILIPAGEIHSYSTPNNSNSTVWFHYIDTVEALNASGHLLLPELETILSSKSHTLSFAEPLFESIEQPLEPCSYRQWLKNLVETVSNLDKEKYILEETEIHSFIEAKQYIQDHLEEPFCLEAISERFSINKWQLSRQFKPIFGVTLFQHIHASRMVLAKELLTQQHSITDVALSLGYSDQSHFTRFFKRFVGISPKKWVQLVENNE
ncbi:MAG: AraC family transcriptional regulator [Thalassotalea sp.]|nr:AraC family transcriptional regulator [Thalassotalea sp.]